MNKIGIFLFLLVFVIYSALLIFQRSNTVSISIRNIHNRLKVKLINSSQIFKSLPEIRGWTRSNKISKIIFVITDQPLDNGFFHRWDEKSDGVFLGVKREQQNNEFIITLYINDLLLRKAGWKSENVLSIVEKAIYSILATEAMKDVNSTGPDVGQNDFPNLHFIKQSELNKHFLSINYANE